MQEMLLAKLDNAKDYAMAGEQPISDRQIVTAALPLQPFTTPGSTLTNAASGTTRLHLSNMGQLQDFLLKRHSSSSARSRPLRATPVSRLPMQPYRSDLLTLLPMPRSTNNLQLLSRLSSAKSCRPSLTTSRPTQGQGRYHRQALDGRRHPSSQANKEASCNGTYCWSYGYCTSSQNTSAYCQPIV